ncbi:(2Fe-2S)-binding protein [Lacimicrobium alkaliphilum]|uniref:2Fe-2S ferredoxin-type domain-containing protein n=1 Tax=Lacimicrobium alkaliphilum TaxID=1526571 RepID=A0A0U2RLT7_9ALTE|nr:(2Fe-2S)-binding protein [Lacimicrobium alkaliphilum]ALS98250.1 hypothetical protein AT746_08310 [Lacimicrobium alkaliphilum]
MSTLFFVNDQQVEAGPDETQMPLLWFLREKLQLTGSKFGCGIGQCGACTVHLDGAAVRSCLLPVGKLQGSRIRTIEGLAQGTRLHPVQQAWLDLDVPQCGYCQAGQIMTAVSLLERIRQPTEQQICDNMTNICRCGAYTRIHKAIRQVADDQADKITES